MGIASRAQQRRLQLGWSRMTLAKRAGVSQWTLKHFESTGQVSLETLAKIAVVLGDAEGLSLLFPVRRAMPASIAELDKLYPAPRKRGRTIP